MEYMTYGSVYEITNPLTTVAKSHFVEWFWGRQLPVLGNANRWILKSSGTAPTVAMQNSRDGGLRLTNSQSGNGGALVFGDNDMKQYAGLCSCIMVLRNVNGATGYTYAGLTSTGYGATGADSNSIAVIEMGASTYFMLTWTESDGTWGRTNTTIPTADTNWHTVKIDIESASINLTVDGVLEATKGSQPYRSGNPRLMPSVNGRYYSANAITDIRYFEAYNR